MSLVEAAIRRRADTVRRWTPSSLPAGVSKWVPYLFEREWRREIGLRTVAAGRNRSFFVNADGALLACGREKTPGLLGVPGVSSPAPFTAEVPTPVSSMAGVRLRAVVCHIDCNLALSEAGQVFAWGHGGPWAEENWSEGPAVVPTPIVALQNHHVCQVVTGYFHSAALTEDGALFTWESRADSLSDEAQPELGFGSFIPVFGAPHRVFAFDGVRITSVAVGDIFTVAVTEAGAVYSFGMGDGRLGHGDDDDGVDVFLPSASRRWMESM
jgi:alpha-tubulin suppressor-like RCC1 family protein